MKTKTVDYITSNEEFVRMRIYDGDLKIDDAAAELLALERSQREAERRRYEEQIRWYRVFLVLAS